MASAAAPAHKLIPGTGFVVDGFKCRGPGISAWFLSHAHADHYTGLRDTWDCGPIYCSEVTGRLIQRLCDAKPELIVTLPMDKAVDVEGVQVTLVDANHCPGAVQFVFRLPSGETFLHCGDMRWHPRLLQHPALRACVGCRAVFLDTTYCSPKYTFPPQEEAVEYVAATIHSLLNSGDGLRRLFLIQTYNIGKERILIEVHRRTGLKIHVSERKMGFMRCLDMPGLEPDMFTTDPDATCVHVTQWGWLGDSWPFFRPNFKNCGLARDRMRVDEVVGFVPTGWTYEMGRNTYPIRRKAGQPFAIHLVPYSEHSSYAELQQYVAFLRPQQVIPTVGVEGAGGEKSLRSILKHFSKLIDATASKALFLAAFQRQDSARSAQGSTAAAAAAAAAGAAGAASGSGSGRLAESAGSGVIDLSDGEELEAPSEREATPEAAGPADEAEAAAKPQPAAAAAAAAAGAAAGSSQASRGGASQPELSLRPWAGGSGSGSGGSAAEPAPAPEQPGSSSANPGGQEQAAAEQLAAVVGGSLSVAAAGQLLAQFGGDVARAANAFLDGQIRIGASGASGRAGASPAARGGKRKASSSSRAPGAGAKQARAGPKAAAAAGAADQRQITAFFGRSPAKRPAVKQEAGEAGQPIDLEGEGEGPAEAAAAPSQPGGPASQEEPATPARQKRRLLLPPAPASGSKKARSSSSSSPAAAQPGSSRVKPEPQGSSAAAEAAAAAATAGAGGSGVKPEPSEKEEPGEGKPLGSPRALAGGGSFSPVAGRAGKAEAAAADRRSEVPPDALLRPPKEYDPVGAALWREGEAAPYLHIARALAAMDGTTKRLRISDVCANMFRSLLALSPEDLLPAAYLVTGRLAPDYEGIEMSVGGSTVSAAVMEATGVTKGRLGSMYKQLGDLGDVAQACRQNQTMLARPAPLTVRGVYAALRGIAAEKGAGSGQRKQRAVLALLRRAREEEPRYLVRTLISNLRVGANWRSVIPALARAFVLHEQGPGAGKAALEAASARVSEAFHLCPSLDVLVPALQAGGLAELSRRCTLTAGVPLKPMLAKICEGIPDALRQLRGAFLAEWKYDGMRCQVHLLADGSVKLFSRNCEDRTVAYPDVVEAVREAAAGGARTLVADAELVAVDRAGEGRRLRAFQELATRARGQTALHEVTIRVCVFVFDLLMADGEPLLGLPLRERRARVAGALPGMRPGCVERAQALELPAPGLHKEGRGSAKAQEPQEPAPAPAAAEPAAAAQEAAEPGEAGEAGEGGVGGRLHSYLLESFAAGAEGLMLKELDVSATYQASRRTDTWIKLKRDYCEGLRDSLDLVPIGAWWGQGRKTGWFSPFLLAAWDPEREEFQSVCRVMSGFSDAFYTEATARLRARTCARKPYYNSGESPAVWFEPDEVWEIRGADLTISPVHRAAIGRIGANPSRGVSLRFPRFIRIREDKSPEDASGPDVIADLFHKQTRRVASAQEQLAARQQAQQQQPQDQAQPGEEEGDESEHSEAEQAAAGAGASDGEDDGWEGQS